MADDLGVSVTGSLKEAQIWVKSLSISIGALGDALLKITAITNSLAMANKSMLGATGASASSAAAAESEAAKSRAKAIADFRLLERQAKEAGDAVTSFNARTARIAIEQQPLGTPTNRLSTLSASAQDQGFDLQRPMSEQQKMMELVKYDLREVQAEYSKLGETGKSRLTKQLLADLQGISSKGIKTELKATAAALRSVGDAASAKKVDQFTKSLDRVKTKTEQTRKTMTLLGNTMKFVLTGLLLKVLYQIGHAMTGTVQNAINLTESFNLFRVALGSSLPEAQKFVDTMSTKFNLNPTELYKSVGMFYQMSIGMQLTTKNALTLSENLTKLSYDLASFYNDSTEVAFTKLKAGIVGETEPLRQWGIITTENALKTQLLKMGIDRTVQSLSEHDKVMLRYWTIMEATKNAQGDWARTLESPANMVRLLQSGMQRLSTTIGSVFLPVLVRVLPYAIAAVQVIGQLITAIGAYFGMDLKPIEFAVGGTGVVSDLTDVGDTADDAASKVDELKNSVLGFDQLNIMTDPTSGTAGKSNIGVGTDSVIPDLVGYDNLMDGLNSKASEVAEKMMASLKTFSETPFFKAIVDAVEWIWKALGDFFTFVAENLNWIAPIAAGVAVFLTLVQVISGVSTALALVSSPVGLVVLAIAAVIAIVALLVANWDKIAPVLQVALDWVERAFLDTANWIWSNFVVPVGTFFSDLWQGISDVFNAAGAFFTTVFNTVWNNIVYAFDSVYSFFAGVWEGIKAPFEGMAVWFGTIFTQAYQYALWTWNTVSSFFAGVWEGIKAPFNGMAVWFGTVFTQANQYALWTWQKIGAFFAGVWAGIQNAFNGIAVWFGTVFTEARDYAIWTWQKIGAFFSGVWEGIKAPFNGMAVWFGTVFTTARDYAIWTWQSIGTFFSGVWEGIKAPFNAAATWFGTVFTGAWEAIKSVFSTVGIFFSGIWDTIVNLFNGIGNAVGAAIGGAFVSVVNSVITFAENTINALISNINGIVTMMNQFLGTNIAAINAVEFGRAAMPPVAPVPTYTGGHYAMATGAIVDSATHAIIGEAGREVVLPLENNTGWMDDLARKVASVIGRGDNKNSSEVIAPLNELMRIIQSAIDNIPRLDTKDMLTDIPVILKPTVDFRNIGAIDSEMIAEAIRLGFKDAIATSSGGKTEFVTNLNGREIAREIIPEIQRMSLRSGVPVLG